MVWWLVNCYVFGNSQVQIEEIRLAILIVCGYAQSLQENSWLVTISVKTTKV